MAPYRDAPKQEDDVTVIRVSPLHDWVVTRRPEDPGCYRFTFAVRGRRIALLLKVAAVLATAGAAIGVVSAMMRVASPNDYDYDYEYLPFLLGVALLVAAGLWGAAIQHWLRPPPIGSFVVDGPQRCIRRNKTGQLTTDLPHARARGWRTPFEHRLGSPISLPADAALTTQRVAYGSYRVCAVPDSGKELGGDATAATEPGEVVSVFEKLSQRQAQALTDLIVGALD